MPHTAAAASTATPGPIRPPISWTAAQLYSVASGGVMWRWTAVLAVAVLAGAQRCSVQTRQEINPDETIELWNSTAGKAESFPEGIKPEPLMPGGPPFFTRVLKSGILCYTGAGTGYLIPKETCRCSAEYAAYVDKLTELQGTGDLSNAEINIEANEALSAAAEACADLETTTRPATVWPTEAAFFEAKEELDRAGIPINASGLGPFAVRGRICDEPIVDVTNAGRDADKLAPWEFINLNSAVAACGCPRDVEYYAENFAPEAPEAAAYTTHIEETEKLTAPPRLPKGGDGKSGQSPAGTCVVFRGGYGWAGAGRPGLTLDGGGQATVTVNPEETEIPLYPGSDQTTSCGGLLNMNERINFCLFGLEDVTDTLEVPPAVVQGLSAYCADSDNVGSADGRFTKCCQGTRVWKTDGNDPATTTMVRRDLLVTLQCRGALYATNSGTGRAHTVPRGPFDDIALRGAQSELIEGTFMPDLRPETLTKVRAAYADSGYSHVCIPPGKATKATCAAFSPTDTSSIENMRDNLEKFKKGINCSTAGADPSSTADGWSSTKAGQFNSLRRASFPWNACVTPPVYATTGRRVAEKLSPADIIRHTMTVPQRYRDNGENTTGWTDDDFNDCSPKDVPILVEAWYRAVQKISADEEDYEEPDIPCGTMLRWWGSMPPEFYIAAASVPLAMGDYWTSQDEVCLPDIPGRGSASTDGVQGPSVSTDHEPPDLEATCSTQLCCGGVPLPANYTGSRRNVCKDSCRTEQDPLELITTRLGVTELEKTIVDCFDNTKNHYPIGDNDPNNPTHFCKFAGQLVRDNTVWKQDESVNVPLFPTDGTVEAINCFNTAAARIRLTDVDIIFISTAPRLLPAPVHPLFQWSGYVKDDGEARNTESTNFNFTATNTKWMDSPAYDDPPLRPTRYPDGSAGPDVPIETRFPSKPDSASATYDGVELAVIADTACLTKNHREAVTFSNGDIHIRIPGLYPRFLDFQQGGTPTDPGIDSCIVFDNGNSANLIAGGGGVMKISNWQTLGDRYSLDLYNRGGGQAPVPESSKEFLKAHTAHYYGDAILTPTTSKKNRPQFPTLGTCLTKDANRCNGKCDLSKEVSNIAESVGTGLAALVATIVVPELIPEATEDVLIGDSVMDEDGEVTFHNIRKKTVKVEGSRVRNTGRFILDGAAQAGTVAAVKYTGDLAVGAAEASSTGKVSIEPDALKGMLHARLIVKKAAAAHRDRYLFMDSMTDRGGDDLLKLYASFPSMARACVKGTGDDCIPVPESTNGTGGEPSQDETWSDLFAADKWAVTGADRKSGAAYAEKVKQSSKYNCEKLHLGVRFDNDDGPQTPWWNSYTAMLESTTLGLQLGCHTAFTKSGNFKQNGPGADADFFDIRAFRYESTTDKDASIEFQTMEANTVSGYFRDGNGTKRLYTAVDENDDFFDVRSQFGPQGLCGLCQAIGPAALNSLRRPECRMENEGTSYFTRYDLEDALAIYDSHAHDFFLTYTGLYTEDIHGVSKICFEYYDTLGNSSSCVDAEGATGKSDVERLLGVNLDPSRTLGNRATPRPACFGNLHSAAAASCDIDAGLFHHATDAPICTSTPVRYKSSCPSPRWANDERVTFPEVVSASAVPGPRYDDFDPRAEGVSYCANGPWNFSEPAWYNRPEGQRPDPRALSRHDPGSLNYVYCAGDPRAPEVRHEFCKGSADTGSGEGYITLFGFRLGIRTSIDDVCHLRPDGVHQCLFYPGETGGGFPTIQSIVDAFSGEEQLDILVIPASFDVISQAVLMFLSDVSTIYYNDPGDVGQENYVESASFEGGVIGQRVNITWERSTTLFPGLCHGDVSEQFLAALYAAIEQFRAPTGTGFSFPNLAAGVENRATRVSLDASAVYPAHTEPRIEFRDHSVTLRGAFTTAVAEAASQIVGRPLPAVPSRFGGLSSDAPSTGCGRVLLDKDGSRVENIRFEQGGPCRTAVVESARVPVLLGGALARDVTIRTIECVDCPTGVVQARGGDASFPDAAPAANVDIDGTFVADIHFFWTTADCASTRLSVCQNATLPGVETAWARVVGDPVVSSCAAEPSGGSVAVDEFCDVLAAQKEPYIVATQTAGSAIATDLHRGVVGPTDCSNECLLPGFETLFGIDDADRCCDGFLTPTIYTCSASDTDYTTADAPADGPCSPVNCLWHKTGNASVVRGSWVDATDVGDFNGVDIPGVICNMFYRICPPGACPTDSTEDCDTCAANKTLFEKCASATEDASSTVPRPCATASETRLSDGTSIPKSMNEVSAELPRLATAVRCSTLGCPPAALHTDHSNPASLGICVPGSALSGFRQTWLVPNDDTAMMPAVDGPILSPGIPATQLPALVELKLGDTTEFRIDDAYESESRRGFYTARIAVVGTVGETKTVTGCLTRPTGKTETGTEPGGPLTVTPCSGTENAQAWLFVFHATIGPAGAWRIQVPGDPFLCITDISDTQNSAYPYSGTLASPVLMPCTACAVGVDETGTSSGPVVSTVLEFPTIKYSNPPVVPEELDDPDDYVFFPLSSTDPTLHLLVSTTTGKCVQVKPPTVGFFGVEVATGASTPVEVPCSLLEGAPIAQINAEAGSETACAGAIGLLVAPCIAMTGGISMIDGTPIALRALCGAVGSGTADVTSARGGTGARIACGGTADAPIVNIVAAGIGFRDGDAPVLGGTPAPAGTVVYIQKLLWMPHESAEAAASEPIVGPTVETVNVSAIFNLYGGDDALWKIYAAGLGSASAAYVAAGLEIAIIAGAVIAHIYYGVKRWKVPSAPQ